MMVTNVKRYDPLFNNSDEITEKKSSFWVNINYNPSLYPTSEVSMFSLLPWILHL